MDRDDPTFDDDDVDRSRRLELELKARVCDLHGAGVLTLDEVWSLAHLAASDPAAARSQLEALTASTNVQGDAETLVSDSGTDATLASDGPPTPKAGRRRTRISGYALQSLLGSGGMGSVHLAHDPSLGRLVALKRAHPGRGGNERFEREALLTAQLEHPG